MVWIGFTYLKLFLFTFQNIPRLTRGWSGFVLCITEAGCCIKLASMIKQKKLKLLKSWTESGAHTSHQTVLAHLGSPPVFFSSFTDTWRNMRKSTTLARMMKNHSREIPKPLFQSVQFPALITTSSMLYQVESPPVYLSDHTQCPPACFHCYSPPHVCIGCMDLGFCCSICLFSVSLPFPKVPPLFLPLGRLKHIILVQVWLQRSITWSELCMRCMGNWLALQVNHMNRNAPQQKLFFIFVRLSEFGLGRMAHS